MTRDRALALILPVALALALVLPGLGRAGFLHEDEWRNAVMVREMAVRGLTLHPTLHGERYPDYPPLYFALGAAAERLEGAPEPSPADLRWPAALGAALLALGTAIAGVRLGSARLGLLAGLLVAVLPGLVFEERRPMIDPLFAGLTTVAVALLASSGREPAEEPRARARRFALGALALALGWLTKGPLAAVVVGLALAGGEGFRIRLERRDVAVAGGLVGALFLALVASALREADAHARRDALVRAVALPLVALGVAALRRVVSPTEPAPGERAQLFRRAALLAGVVLAIAVAWFGAAFLIAGREFGWNLLRTQTIGRVLEIEQHQKPFYYYAGSLAALLPVALFALGGAWLQRFKADRSRAGVFALGWFVLVVVFFSWSKTKRSYYVMPAYPAVALLAACAFERLHAKATEHARLRDLARGAHVVVFALLALAAAVAPIGALAEPAVRTPLLCGMTAALVGAALMAVFVLRERLALGLVAGSACALAGASVLVPHFVAARHTREPFARKILDAGVDRAGGAIALARGGLHREALCWWLAPDALHGVPYLIEGKADQGRADPAKVLAFLAKFPPGKAAVIVEPHDLTGELDLARHDELEVIARDERADSDELVALARRR